MRRKLRSAKKARQVGKVALDSSSDSSDVDSDTTSDSEDDDRQLKVHACAFTCRDACRL